MAAVRKKNWLGDGDAVRRVRKGEREAFADLVERYRDTVYALAWRHLGNAEDARDAAQEAFVQAYLCLDQLREPDRFGPWLRQVTVNQCRMRQRAPVWVELPTDVAAISGVDVERLATQITVRQALATLSEVDRLALTLHYAGGASLREIAAFLDVPLTTIKSRLRDARARLRKELVILMDETLNLPPLPADFTQQVTARIVGPTDREALARFLAQDPLLHVCLLDGLEKMQQGGTEQDPCHVYWRAERGGEIKGALMKISNNWVPAASDPACAPEFARYVDGSEGPQMIYGPRAITDALVARLTRHHVVESEHDALLVLKELAVDPATLPPARRATLADAEAVSALYDNEEVPRHASSVRAHINSEQMGLRLWFCADASGRAVSACLTRYEARDAALIGLVYTRPDARGQGWTTACVAGMCAELLREGKRPCYSGETPWANVLCRNVGFRPQGDWSFHLTEPRTESAG